MLEQLETLGQKSSSQKMERKVVGSIPQEDIAFSIFNLVIMIVSMQYYYSEAICLL